MFKIIRAVRQILNSINSIKDLTESSMAAEPKYLRASEEEGYIEDARDEFVFIRVLPDYVEAKAKYSICGLREEVHPIDWLGIKKGADARFAEKIIRKAIKDFLVIKNTVEEFKEFKSQGYNFKEVRDSIANHNSFQCENIEGKSSSNNSSISKSLSERMKGLSISGYISRYAGDDGLRQDIEDVMHKKAYVMQEFMMRVSELPAYEVQFDQLKQVDILGEH